jgi:hypothetical protein
MVRRLAAALRGEWGSGRLSLAGLRPAQRVVAASALVAILVAAGVILAASLGITLPGGTVAVPGRLLASKTPIEVPPVAVALAAAGLAAAAATVGYGVTEPGGKAGSRLLAAIILTSAALGGLVLSTIGAVEFAVRITPGASGLIVPVYTATGWLALASAGSLPVLVAVAARIPRTVIPVIAAVPYAGLLLSTIVASGPSATIDPWTQAQFPDYPPVLTVTALMFGPIMFLVGSATGLIALLVLWQSATWSRASARQIGTRIGRAARRMSWILAALIGAKIAWLLLGRADLLPPALGGTSGAWAGLRSDDAFSWAYVGLLGVAVGIWLLRGRTAIDERLAGRTAGYVIAAFACLSLLIAVHPLVSPLLGAIWPGTYPAPPDDIGPAACFSDWLPLGGLAFVSCLASVAPAWLSIWWGIVILAALIAGVVLFRRRPDHAGAVFLVALGAWSLPRAIDVVRQTAPPELAGLRALPAMNAPQPETLDVAITVLVTVLAIAWWTGRQARVDPLALVVVLVTSTLLVHAGTIAPSAPLTFFLAAAVAFPVLYELAFDSEELNEPTSERPGTLLASLGLRAFVLTLLATLVVVDIGALAGSTDARLGFLIFGPPFAAVVVAATVRPRIADNAPEPDRPAADSPTILRALAATGLAGAAVVGIALASVALQPVLGGLYATGADRLSEFEGRVAAVEAEVNDAVAAAATDETVLPARLMTIWTSESRWLAAHPAHDCAAGAWDAWRDVIDRYRAVAILLAATDHQPATAPQAEIDAVHAAHDAAMAELGPGIATFTDALAAARGTCADA